MHQWLELFHGSLPSEKGPPLGALATVDGEGRPRVRYVVCHLEPDGRIWFGTNARSNKNRHVKERPQVELVFWTAATGRQFRVEGLAEPIRNAGMLRRIWQGMTDQVRAFYHWPDSNSAARSDPSLFPAAVPATTPPPPNFEPIIVAPAQVEMLDVSLQPHVRRVWSRQRNWSAADVNP
jgi:general stress protein 26